MRYYTARPSLDENYPAPNTSARAITIVDLYDITTGQMPNSFKSLKPCILGAFSTDSQFLAVRGGAWADNQNNVYTGDFVYEIATGTIIPQGQPQ